MLYIPQELREVKQWSYSFDSENLKRPKHSHYTLNGSLAFSTAVALAKEKQLSFGFYTTLQDPYIIGDIDHLEDPNNLNTYPQLLKDFLLHIRPYVEISPSGKGVRFVCKFPQIIDKELLKGKIFYPVTEFEGRRKQEAQINIGPPWLRFTGRATAFNTVGIVDVIPEVSLQDLNDYFALKYKGIEDALEVEESSEEGVPHGTPDIKLPRPAIIRTALMRIPIDQNPRIIRAYQKVFKEAYTHYNFWLKIIMALHDYGSKAHCLVECLQWAIKWSRQDPEAYTGDDAVITKWKSLTQDKEESVSFHTLLAVQYNCELRWPKAKPPTKAQKQQGIYHKIPLNTEYANFQALVDYYNLQVYRDVNARTKMYITGDTDIIDQYFSSLDTTYYYEKYRGIFSEKTLIPAFHIMCQEKGFIGISANQVQQFIRNWIYQINKTIDIVRYYFDTPFEQLPISYQDNAEYWDMSTVETMFSCLDISYLTTTEANRKLEWKLYKKYYVSWLMGFVRNLYWPNTEHTNNCVLLLTGREQIRKTSHFKYMLPKFMREDRIAFTPHGFGTETAMRDVTKLAAGNSIVIWDEIEQFLNKETESNFKKIIDNNPQKFIDKYEVIESVWRPVAIYGGTSNKTEFQLSDTGSRRLFIIPVNWVDTDTLNKICWWRVVYELKTILKAWFDKPVDDPPWLLTRQELAWQDRLIRKVTVKSDLELIIEEIWDFTEPCILDNPEELAEESIFKSDHFKSTRAISGIILMYSKGAASYKRSYIIRILKRLCGKWTRTYNEPRAFDKPKIIVNQGLARYGRQHELWVLPPRKASSL
jgi:hypothetical protein